MPPDILRYAAPRDAIADSRLFLRSASPLRSWLLPSLRLMDRKMGRPMVGGGVERKGDPAWKHGGKGRWHTVEGLVFETEGVSNRAPEHHTFPASQTFVELYDEVAAEKAK